MSVIGFLMLQTQSPPYQYLAVRIVDMVARSFWYALHEIIRTSAQEPVA